MPQAIIDRKIVSLEELWLTATKIGAAREADGPVILAVDLLIHSTIVAPTIVEMTAEYRDKPEISEIPAAQATLKRKSNRLVFKSFEIVSRTVIKETNRILIVSDNTVPCLTFLLNKSTTYCSMLCAVQ